MPRPKVSRDRKNFGISLEKVLMRELQHLALDEGRRTNEMVEEAIRDLLRQYREKRKG